MNTLLIDLEISEARFAGNKAARLAELLREGFNVPRFFVIATQHRYEESLPGRIEDGIRAVCPGGDSFAVRSSSPEEDGSEASFAGQFETVLNVAPAGHLGDGFEPRLGRTG